jgi:hypothetical protein
MGENGERHEFRPPASGGWFWLPNVVAKCSTLHPRALKVLCYLASQQIDGVCDRSLSEILNETGLSRNTVIAAVGELVGLKLLRVECRGRRHVYDLTPLLDWFTKRTGSESEPVQKVNHDRFRKRTITGSESEPRTYTRPEKQERQLLLNGEACSEPLHAASEQPSDDQEKPTHPFTDVSPRPSESKAGDPVELVYPIVGGKRGKGPTEWPLRQSKLAEYRESFPGVDVLAECRKALQWCRDSPTKRKTFGGMAAFLTRWLSKEQNSGQSGARRNESHGRAPTGGGSFRS